MNRNSLLRKLGGVLVCAFALVFMACGGEDQASNRTGSAQPEQTQATTTSAPEETTAKQEPESEEDELAKVGIGPKEITNMIPADGKKPDPPQPLPKNPPKGIKVYPATTNMTTRKPIQYTRKPPTNGRHDPLWQNCGYYEKPIQDRHAVHSLDHGVVWITYQSNLPQRQIEKLRSYGSENYVIVSPYPGQGAPVTVTSWRVQLELQNASDPRLRKFVDQFRVSELAPLSGNRCEMGVGNPA